MAQKRTLSSPQTETKEFSLRDIDRGIAKLRQRIVDVQALDPRQDDHRGAAVKNVEHAIRDTIREVFGPQSQEARDHPHGEIYYNPSRSVARYGDGDLTQEFFAQGIPQMVKTLEGLIAKLEEKRLDIDEPVEHSSSPGVEPKSQVSVQEGNQSSPNPTRVFIVYGRNTEAQQAMVLFLRALNLRPLDFDEVRNSIGGSPFVGKIIEKGLREAQAIVVLFTPDEFASLRPGLIHSYDPDHEKGRWQARPNVILEAGMALALAEPRTILVVLGNVSLSSDLHGRHYIQLNNNTDSRERLKNALIGAGCEISPSTSGWHNPAIAGNFESCLLPPALLEVSLRSPFAS